MKKHYEKTDIQVRDIDATLNRQIYSSKIWGFIFKTGFAMFILFFICGIFLAIFPGNEDEKEASKIMIHMMGIVSVIMFFVCLYLDNEKRQVRRWLRDAVILKAITKTVDKSTAPYPLFVKTTAIQIKFSYMGKHYVKRSEYKGEIRPLYVFNKYADKEILIAYSPKYDQVMFIKPKSEQRILTELSKKN